MKLNPLNGRAKLTKLSPPKSKQMRVQQELSTSVSSKLRVMKKSPMQGLEHPKPRKEEGKQNDEAQDVFSLRITVSDGVIDGLSLIETTGSEVAKEGARTPQPPALKMKLSLRPLANMSQAMPRRKEWKPEFEGRPQDDKARLKKAMISA